MSLQQKLDNLKLNAALAVKHANGWQRLINIYGEDRATEFYKHLGLNHLETKSFEWEGLTLSREPKEHEKIAVKGIHGAQESAKGAIGKTLLAMRTELISAGLLAIKRLKPGNFHELILNVSRETSDDLSEELAEVYQQGRVLVAAELGGIPKGFTHQPGCNDKFLRNEPRGYQCNCAVKATAEDEFDELEDLVDLTTSRVTNDVQSRIIDAAARHALLGQTGEGLINAVSNEINSGSVTYIDRAARGLANKVINIGRGDEAEARSDEWDRVEYSSLLDQNVCEPCAAEDGQTASSEDDLQPVPNPDCAGGEMCRCFLVWVNQ